MFNRGNYIFNPNFQKGTSSNKKTNFGIIREPDQLLFRRYVFFISPIFFISKFLLADFYSKETFFLQYYSLAFVASFKRATDEGSLPEIAQNNPSYLPLNVFTASKGSKFYILSFRLRTYSYKI